MEEDALPYIIFVLIIVQYYKSSDGIRKSVTKYLIDESFALRFYLISLLGDYQDLLFCNSILLYPIVVIFVCLNYFSNFGPLDYFK